MSTPPKSKLVRESASAVHCRRGAFPQIRVTSNYPEQRVKRITYNKRLKIFLETVTQYLLAIPSCGRNILAATEDRHCGEFALCSLGPQYARCGPLLSHQWVNLGAPYALSRLCCWQQRLWFAFSPSAWRRSLLAATTLCSSESSTSSR